MKNKKITPNTQKKLLLSYYDILENIYNKAYTDSELDNLLLTFLTFFRDDDTLSSSEKEALFTQIKGLKNAMNKKQKKLLKENIENRKRIIAENKDNIYKTYIEISSQDFTEQEIDKILQSVLKSVENLKEFNIDIEQITKGEDLDFKRWLEDTVSVKVSKPKNDSKVEERLYRHFKKPPKQKNKKTINTEFEVNEQYEQNLLLALITSTLADQSDVNRIKSLKNSGATLTESIKTVIPIRKHNEIKKLVQIQRDKYQEYLNAQHRLI